jgi:tetratricopeptide (TPR) repeat protein
MRLAQDRATAVIAALIFAVHPALIESVAWVSGCTDPLLACCLIPAFLFFLKWRENGSAKWLLASLGCYVLALMAKEPAVMLVALVFAFAWLSPQDVHWIRRFRIAVVAALPYFLLTLVYAVLHRLIDMRMDRSGSAATLARMLLTAPKLLLFYVRLLVVPWPISPEYDLQLTKQFSLTSVLLPAIGVIVIVLAVLAWTRQLSRNGEQRTARNVRFASVWLLLPILPVLNIAAIAPFDFAHARYLYMSCIGFALIVACIIRRIPGGGHSVFSVPRLQAAVAMVLVALLAFANVTQQVHWASSLLLFYRGARIAPHNPIALTGLATELGKRQQYDKALALLQDSLEQDPGDPHTNFILGYTYFLTGRYNEAEMFLERGVSIRPEDIHADQFAYVSMAELKIGNLSKAEWAIRQAMQRQPNIEKYHYALGLVLEKQGKQTEAATAFKDALAINPANADARERLARMQNAAN